MRRILEKGFAGVLLPAIAGGILMGLAPDPYGMWWWAWVALVPLWWITQRQGIGASLAAGIAWGLCYHGMSLFWITGVHPMTWLGVNWWASLAIAATVWLLITFWGAVLSGLWAGGMAWLTPKLPLWQRAIVGGALLCLLETIWSWGPLYWTALGYTQSPHALLLLQISRLSGQQTVSAAIVLVNGLLAEILMLFRSRSRRQLPYLVAVLGLLVAAIVGFGIWAMSSDRLAAENGKALRVGIVQGNIPNPVKLKFNGLQRAIERYTDGYVRLVQAGAEMVLTPEVALPFLFPDPIDLRAPFDAAVRQYGKYVWTGGFGHSREPESMNYTNSLFLLDGSGRSLAQYDKVRLVPIGEYIPFRSILGGIIRRLSPLRGEVEAGSSSQIVDAPFGRVIVGICYESAYPSHFRYQAAAGGQLILTASNNAHYAETMPAQHHAQDVARAVETDRWAVRATNTGYSGIVDPSGRTRWISGINTYETHLDTVYLRQTRTLYVQWGDWLTPTTCALSLGFLLKQRLR